MRWIPFAVTVAVAIAFLIADSALKFQFGLRTYWPVLVVVYLLVRLGVETRPIATSTDGFQDTPIENTAAGTPHRTL